MGCGHSKTDIIEPHDKPLEDTDRPPSVVSSKSPERLTADHHSDSPPTSSRRGSIESKTSVTSKDPPESGIASDSEEIQAEEAAEESRKRKRLEEERKRAKEELERIRTGAPKTPGSTMGVVNSSMNGGPVKEIAIDRHTLEAYLRVEKEIAKAEQSNPLQPLDLKADQLARLTEEVEQKETALRELEVQTNAFGNDTPDEVFTKKVFIDNGIREEPLNKTQEQYLDTVNKKEIAEQELEAAKQQKLKVQEELKDLEIQAGQLQELYKRQDTLLDKMFGGNYGSHLENKLEQELDTLESHRGRILEANFKWRQAQMMLEYACKQLAVAVQKWQDLPTLPTIDLEIRYSAAAETRNNLVAAGQNLNGAQRYLENVQFPYCDPNEVSTLNKQATEYVFTDMQSTDRHSHAQACYTTSYKRANALLQWFDTVINTTIMKDLADINDKVKVKTLELRQERVRLIQSKLREMWGADVDLGETLRDQDVDLEKMARSMLNSGQVVKVAGSETDMSRANTPPMLSNSELAPMPSNNVIFGNMYDHYQEQLDAIAAQHQQELQTFIKDQEQKQQKIRGSLEEKLALRRQRRARQNLERAQKNALTAQ